MCVYIYIYMFDNVEIMFVASRGVNQAKFTTWKTILQKLQKKYTFDNLYHGVRDLNL